MGKGNTILKISEKTERNTWIKPSCLRALLIPGKYGSIYGLCGSQAWLLLWLTECKSNLPDSVLHILGCFGLLSFFFVCYDFVFSCQLWTCITVICISVTERRLTPVLLSSSWASSWFARSSLFFFFDINNFNEHLNLPKISLLNWLCPMFI